LKAKEMKLKEQCHYNSSSMCLQSRLKQMRQQFKQFFFPHSRTVHLDIIKVFYLPTDAQENCFKKNITIYIEIARTCFGAITIIRERII
jgi:hypothetical protein